MVEDSSFVFSFWNSMPRLLNVGGSYLGIDFWPIIKGSPLSSCSLSIEIATVFLQSCSLLEVQTHPRSSPPPDRKYLITALPAVTLAGCNYPTSRSFLTSFLPFSIRAQRSTLSPQTHPFPFQQPLFLTPLVSPRRGLRRDTFFSFSFLSSHTI